MASSYEGTPSGSDYQVFLSFRGPDTRTSFADVLFHNLNDAGICVYRDDEELRVGERIDRSLWQAIDNSKIYIPIFSSTYASSKWCLRELTRIVANTVRSEGDKEILPIFFDVEPNDVKLKSSLYCDAILNLECEKKFSNEEVDEWRKALKEVGAIKGWEVTKYKGHGKLIKLVIEEVIEKLKTKHRSVSEHLVGIEDRVVAVIKLLDINGDDVQFLKIHGMGGIGKTTLAKVVFNRLSSHFGKCCCFLEDVREKSTRIDGLLCLQKRLLSEIGVHAGTRSIDEIDYGMKRIGEMLCNKKVFIVLDDVDNNEQVEKLVGKSSLYSGSRILITTRNKHVLQINRLKYQILDYEMELMSIDHALELFNRHAFNKDSPSNDYNDLSRDIVHATGRLPLALEVIGSFLFDKRKQIWLETLEKLSKAPHVDVFGKLKISYDALTFEQKQIFLDIACLLIGEDKMNANYMWEDCKFFPNIGVDVLISMSLIKIGKNNKFWMHDQLRDLGREIVHQENLISPGKRSRLWDHEDILDTITTKKKKNIQALDLCLRRSHHEVVIKSEDIGRFEHLRYLKLNGGTFVGNLANCLTKLRWMSWSYPTRGSKPTNMHLKNVVVLQFSRNEFIDDSELQSITKMTRKLKALSLEGCLSITKTPDFSECLNLERLNFNHCHNLRKIDGSIGKLKSLIDLEFNSCYTLGDLPEEIGDLENLKRFFIYGSKVKKLPSFIWKLKSLHTMHFDSIYDRKDLANSSELPSAIGMLQNLEVLIISVPHLKGRIPSEIECLPFLRILNLLDALISEIPRTIGTLPHLQRLELMRCHNIQELPMLPTSLTHLLVSSESLRVVPDLSNLTNLVKLELNNWGREGGEKLCTGELWWIGRLSKLTELSLGLPNVRAPAELASLSLLNELQLIGLDLPTFPQLPLSLQKLCLDDFNLIEPLFPNLGNLSCLRLHRSLMQEFRLDGLQLPHIRELDVQRCGCLERFRLSSFRKLTTFVVRDCQNLGEIQFSRVFESLEILHIERCESLGRLVYMGEAGHDNNETVDELISCEGRLILPSRTLNKLQSLILGGCHKIHEIQVASTSESWEILCIYNCPYVQSIGGLSNLKNLRVLRILNNNGLRVVEGLDELEFLDLVQFHECRSLEKLIDVGSTKLPNDCGIYLSGMQKDFEGSLESYKHHKEQERESHFKREQEQEHESHVKREQEQEHESHIKREQEQESHLKRAQEHEQESHLKREQEQEIHLEQEQELQQRRRLERVSFRCLSFNSFLHFILPCFFPFD